MSADLKIGSIYKVNSRRKGIFNMALTELCETWATGIILTGKAGAILPENERYQGEEITVRRGLCTFDLVEGGTQ